MKEAARILLGINDTSSKLTFATKIGQLQLERNYGEVIRLLQARLAEFHFDLDPNLGPAAPFEKAFIQFQLALTQRLADDTAGAKITAQPARNIFERLYKDQPDDPNVLMLLAYAQAVMGEKEAPLNLAQRAVTLDPRAKDPINGPTWEEGLALVQVLVGENSGAISTLSRLLRTPYDSYTYNPTGVTPALLRLDPIWDPLRSDPAFQKLCEEK